MSVVTAREGWRAAGVFTALTIVFTYPLSVDPGRVVLADSPDTHLFIWTLGWIAHALASQPLGIFDANIFHPLGHTLAFSENLIGSGLLAAPVIWLTRNYVLALNVVSLLSVALCGFGGYFLARKIGLGVAAAFVCGIVFAFCPTRFFRLGQLHLTTVQWMPFALGYFHAYLDRGRPRDLKLSLLFFTTQTLTSGHGAVFLGVAMAALFVFRVLTGTPVAFLRRVRDVGLPGVVALVPAALIALPYQIVQHEHGLRRTLENWTVPAISFAASPSHVHQAILSLFVPLSWVSETASAYLFPGYLPLLLAGCALFVPVRLKPGALGRHGGLIASRIADQSLFYGLLAAVTILLTVGRPLGLWPFVYWLPGFNFIRVPSRFWILTTLAFAVLSAIGMEKLRERLSGSARAIATGLAGALLLAEFSAIPLVVTPLRVRPPAADRWLADQSAPFVVAEVPFSGTARDQTTYMLHSMAHWQKTVHGYSGFDPAGHGPLYDALRRFPSQEAFAQLRSFGVTHVIVHIDRYTPERWPAVDTQLATAPELELLFQNLQSRVYRLRNR